MPDIGGAAQDRGVAIPKQLESGVIPDFHGHKLGAPADWLTKTVPFLLPEGDLSVNKHLGRRFFVLPLAFVFRDGAANQIASGLTGQMEALTVVVIPPARCTFEDKPIARVEKHLRPTGRGLVICPALVFFENQADIANAIANASDLPRSAVGFVERSRGHIPNDLGLHFAYCLVSRGVPKMAEILKRSLPQNLCRDHVLQQAGLKLVSEVLF